MKHHICRLVAFISCLLASAPAFALSAYITESFSNDVSVIDTATNTETATIPVGNNPFGVAVTPDGSKVYVTNGFSVAPSKHPGKPLPQRLLNSERERFEALAQRHHRLAPATEAQD
jgi:YVTN family beta-propeller protein